MEFSSLVLMEVDKDNKFVGELGSYDVLEGAEYVTKFFYKEDKINLYFDTKEDVEEWQYTAIYDLFNLEAFEEKGYGIEEKDDEYNPTWIVEFDYIEEHSDMKEKLTDVCELISVEIKNAFEEAEKKKEEYL
ncbi:DUF6762 family protein [Clostridium ganghwense]|uniref:DUF1292 domain-containing protein n=1 Tax=Clostridium ganghwense TaxID=312089 RepID=A0ABT4CPI0_9CLOT|nr:DUF6762 family protein [Clostridium ganghwense]MCY6370959.1 hypothetical protein [Clostridium ganghwense]